MSKRILRDRYVAGWAKGRRVTIARLKEWDQIFLKLHYIWETTS